MLVLMVLARLPFWLSDAPPDLTEADAVGLGRRLAEGFTLYRDSWTTVPPLLAGLYQLLYISFGNTTVSHQVLAFLLVLIQAGMLSRMTIRMDMYNERTYVPALIYGCFFSLHPSFMSLSGPLVGITFLLPSLRIVLGFHERVMEYRLVQAGIWSGLAALCYFPFVVLLLLQLLVLILYRPASFRQLLLTAFGFGLVWLLTGSWFFYRDAGSEMFRQLILSAFTYPTDEVYEWPSLFWLLLLPGLYLLASLFRVLPERGFINFQVSCQNAMIWWMLLTGVTFLLATARTPLMMVPLAVPFAFFFTHLLLLQKRRWVGELLTLGMMLSFLLVGYNSWYTWFPSLAKAEMSQMQIQEVPAIQGRSVLVLGKEGRGYYLNNRAATPYMHPKLATYHLDNLSRPSVVREVFQHFMADPPDLILDHAELVPVLFSRIPALAMQYRVVGKGQYERKVKE